MLHLSVYGGRFPLPSRILPRLSKRSGRLPSQPSKHLAGRLRLHSGPVACCQIPLSEASLLLDSAFFQRLPSRRQNRLDSFPHLPVDAKGIMASGVPAQVVKRTLSDSKLACLRVRQGQNLLSQLATI